MESRDSETRTGHSLLALPPISPGGSVSFKSSGSLANLRDLEETLTLAPQQRPRQTLMQRLNDMYSSSLHDPSLNTTKRLASITTSGAKKQTFMVLPRHDSSASSLDAPSLGGLLSRYHDDKHQHSSMSVVKVLSILDKHKQSLNKLQTAKVQEQAAARHHVTESPQGNDQASSRDSSPLADRSSRWSARSGRPSSASKTALTQLAFQDLRRTAEIKAHLQHNSSAVPVSPERLSRRPDRTSQVHLPRVLNLSASGGGGGSLGVQGTAWLSPRATDGGQETAPAGQADDAAQVEPDPAPLLARPSSGEAGSIAGSGETGSSAGSRLNSPMTASSRASTPLVPGETQGAVAPLLETQASPRRRGSSPGKRKSSPGKRKPSPGRKKSSPGKRGSSPGRKKDASPKRGGSSPSKRESAPGKKAKKGGKGGRSKSRSGRGKHHGSKYCPDVPASPAMRVSGVPAPFVPGVGVAWETPEQWGEHTRSRAQSMVQGNPAGFNRRAAIAEYSQHHEASERAHEVMQYVEVLPDDRIAHAMLEVAVQELRFRRPFFYVPPARPERVARVPTHITSPVLRPNRRQSSMAARNNATFKNRPATAPEQDGAAAPGGSRPHTASSVGTVGEFERTIVLVWNVESSVFAPRLRESDAKALLDTPVVLEQQLAVDWKHIVFSNAFRKFVSAEDLTLEPRVNRPDKALEAIRLTLLRHAAMLQSVFAYYTARSIQDASGQGAAKSLRDLGSETAGPPPAQVPVRRSITFSQYSQLVQDLAVSTVGAKHNNPAACLGIFDIVSRDSQPPPALPGTSTPASASSTLTRSGFYEALVRLAALKYCRLGPHDSLAEALHKLIVDNVQALLPPKALHSANSFRVHRLYVQEVHTALQHHLPLLQALFDRGCTQPGCRRDRMGLSGWLHVLDISNLSWLLRERVACSTLDPYVVFCWSQMTVVGESQDPDAVFGLAWPDFLEAMARIADLVSPPPVDEVEVLLREVVQVPQEELQAVMGAHPWYTFYSQLPADKAKVFRRTSARLMAEKTLPLGPKITGIMDFVTVSLKERFRVGVEAELAAVVSGLMQPTLPKPDEPAGGGDNTSGVTGEGEGAGVTSEGAENAMTPKD